MQFDDAAKILGIDVADLVRQVLRTFIKNWWGHAYDHAQKAAREIVKKKFGKLNMNDQAQVTARIEELRGYDFRKEIKQHLRIDRLPTVGQSKAVGWGEVDQYFARLEVRTKDDRKRLAEERAQLKKWMAEQIMHHIHDTLQAYRRLDQARAQAKRTPYYSQLPGDKQHEPWALDGIALSYALDSGEIPTY